MHVLRRKLDCQILLFNNEIYGRPRGNIRRPAGSERVAFDAVRVSRRRSRRDVRLGSGARFIARGIEVHKILPDVLKAPMPQGREFIEIYQNCIVYNDDVFASFTARDFRPSGNCGSQRRENTVAGGTKGIALDGERLVSR